MTFIKFLPLLFFLNLAMTLYSCKKQEVCNQVEVENKINIKYNIQDFVVLENSGDILYFVFDGVDEGRCSSWLVDSSNTCNTLCGDAKIAGHIEINSDTLFYFNYYMDGCRLEQISPKIDLRYNGIKILFERLDPYPEDNSNIILEDYVATFKIFQTVEICEKE